MALFCCDAARTDLGNGGEGRNPFILRSVIFSFLWPQLFNSNVALSVRNLLWQSEKIQGKAKGGNKYGHCAFEMLYVRICRAKMKSPLKGCTAVQICCGQKKARKLKNLFKINCGIRNI